MFVCMHAYKHARMHSGCIINRIKGSNKAIKKRMNQLQQQHWINNHTRAVLLEFSTYNPNVNLFAVCTIAAEWIPGGGIIPYYRVDPIRLITFFSGFGLLVYLCMVGFLVFICYFTLRELRLMVVEGCAYWRSYWAWAQWSVLLAAYSTVFLFFYKLYLTGEIMEVFATTYGNGYVRLQRVALIDEIYGYHLGWMIFVSNIQLLKILKFNNRMSMLIMTLASCWSDLSSFLGIFFLAFSSFVQMFFFILYTDMDEFKTIKWAFQTCFTMMLNKFKFGTLKVNVVHKANW